MCVRLSSVSVCVWYCEVVVQKMASNEFVFVDTEYGPVKGVNKVSVLGNNYINFQGIPYMKAPTGKLRFRVNETVFV